MLFVKFIILFLFEEFINLFLTSFSKECKIANKDINLIKKFSFSLFILSQIIFS